MMKSVSSRLVAVIAAAALAVSLSGCESERSAQETPTMSPSPAVTTPFPEPTKQPDLDDVSTWIASPNAMGPIALGDDFADSLQKVPEWQNDEQCSWVAFWNTPDGTMNIYFARDSAIDDGPVNTVSVSGLESIQPADGPHTDAGIGLDSTREEVLAAYPDAVEQTSTIDEQQLLRVGEQGTAAMFFTIDPDGTVSTITVTSADEPSYEVCG